MTDATTPNIAPGWYPDPAGSGNLRWWDGTVWTEQFQQPYSPDAPAAALRAPEGTKAYTPWIWLVVFLPYLTLPFLFTLDFGSLINEEMLFDDSAAVRTQLAFFTSPGVLVISALGWLTTIGTLVFSWLDWRTLQARGVPRPFAWPWAFFSLAGYPVYAIGRAVVTKRRTGHGSAVLWATIIAFVVGFIVATIWGIVISVQLTQTVIELAPSLG